MAEGRAYDSELWVSSERLVNRTQGRRLDLGVAVEDEEQITRSRGHTSVYGCRKSFILGQLNDDVHGVFLPHRVSGVVGAPIVDNDHFVGPRIAQPQCGKTPKGELTGLVCRDDYRESQVIFHGAHLWYQR
jgi:hypothetical protein